MPRNIILTTTLPGSDPVEFVTPGALPQVLSGLVPGDYRLYSAVAFSTGTVLAVPLSRLASTASSVALMSGHSLVDDAVSGNPGEGETTSPMYYLRDSIYDDATAVDARIVSVTIPGSPLRFHWENVQRPWGEAARTRIDEANTLLVTGGTAVDGSAGPNETDPGRQALWLLFVENLLNFAEQAFFYGDDANGAELILYSNWVELNTTEPGGFRGMLDHQEEAYNTAADYVTWKMKQLYPGVVPDTYRVWVAPGHEVMKRLWDYHQATGLPGITSFDELFVDNIHADHLGDYAVACMVTSMMYQYNFAADAGAWVTPQIASNTAYADLVQQMAWDIVNDEARCGLGGQTYGISDWEDGVTADYLPSRAAISDTDAPIFGEWPTLTIDTGASPSDGSVGTVYDVYAGTTLGPGPITTTVTLTQAGVDVTGSISGGQFTSTAEGELVLTVDLSSAAGTAQRTASQTIANASTAPDGLMRITPTSYDGPTLTGTLPAAAGGFRTITAGATAEFSAALAISGGVHVTMAVRNALGSFAGASCLIGMFSTNFKSWPGFRFGNNGYLNDWFSDGNNGAGGFFGTSGAGAANTWQVIELWTDGTTFNISVNGGAEQTSTFETAAAISATDVYFGWMDPDTLPADTFDVAALQVTDGIPTAAERLALRDWADDIIAGIPA